MIKIYSNLVDYLSQLEITEKENPDQTYLLETNYKGQIFSTFKNFFIGLFYLTHKKHDELHTIMHLVQENLKDAKSYYNSNKLAQNKSVSLAKCVENSVTLENLLFYTLSQNFVRINELSKLQASETAPNKKSNDMHIDSGLGKKGRIL